MKRNPHGSEKKSERLVRSRNAVKMPVILKMEKPFMLDLVFLQKTVEYASSNGEVKTIGRRIVYVVIEEPSISIDKFLWLPTLK